MRTLIENGTLVTGADLLRADLLIEGEAVGLVGIGLARRVGPVDRVVDATGLYVLPGGVDVHTHLSLSTAQTVSTDDFETGTRAAAFGGTTTILDFAAQPKGGTLAQGLAERHAQARGKACIDYGFHMVVREVTRATLAQMDLLVREEGVSSFKVFMAYPGLYQLDDASILRALQQARDSGALILAHAENGGAIDVLVAQALARGETAPRFHALTRPAALEAEATGRCLALAEVAKAPLYIVHLSSREALDRVREAREKGLPAFAETCPHYLFLTRQDLDREGFEGAKFVCSPPLREREDAEALWRGLALGHVQVVATDHCPFDFRGQKELGRAHFAAIPNGLPAIETRLSLLWDGGVRGGRFDVQRFVQLTSTAPARLFGLYPKKGSLLPGADADVVVWDPQRTVSLDQGDLHMRVDYSPYEGRRALGGPRLVFARGELLVDGGEWLGSAGRGHFLRRGRSGA
jgi:dihydropyrimidinase